MEGVRYCWHNKQLVAFLVVGSVRLNSVCRRTNIQHRNVMHTYIAIPALPTTIPRMLGPALGIVYVLSSVRGYVFLIKFIELDRGCWLLVAGGSASAASSLEL